MSDNCNQPVYDCQPVDVPTVDNTPDPCACGYSKPACVIFEQPDEYLELPAEATLLEVIEALKAKIQLLETPI